MAVSSFSSHHTKRGFTLIELVIGIATLSIAMLVMTGALFPQAQRSVDPWFQVRTAELANSVMNEILARRFDENTNVSDSTIRCNETGAPVCNQLLDNPDCSEPIVFTNWLDANETDKVFYDDVDDFHCYSATGDVALAGNDITNSIGENLDAIYSQFTIDVRVVYAGVDLGFNPLVDPLAAQRAKRISVTVTSPLGEEVTYTSYKTNY